MDHYGKYLEDHLQLFAVCLMQKRDYLISQPLDSIISYYT